MVSLKLYEAVSWDYYKNKISKEWYDQLVKQDPTPTKKYAAWMLNLYLKDPQSKYYLETAKWYLLPQKLKEYDLYKTKNIIPAPFNDIMKFKSILDFKDYMTDNDKKFKTALEAKKSIKSKEIKVIFKDKEHLVISPLSMEASRKFGTGTSWCTATSNGSYFIDYTDNGTLYIHRFIDQAGSFEEEAYQMYIPNKDADDYKNVLCMDADDNEVGGLEDTFFKGLPNNVVEEFNGMVEKVGGFKGERSYDIIVDCTAEPDDGVIIAYVNYELYERDNDGEIYSIDNEIAKMSRVSFQPIGRHTSAKEEETEEEKVLLNSPDFNFENGTGILITYYGNTPAKARQEAQRDWGDRVDYFDRDYDTYDVDRYMKAAFDGLTVDYYVLSGEPVIDDLAEEVIYPFIRDIDDWEDEMYVTGLQGKTYTITCRAGYNFSTTGDWVSTPRQRRQDRQLDFPDMD